MKIPGVQLCLAGIEGRRPLILRFWTDEGISGLGEAALAYGSGA
jgi:galactonate dehydratase